MKIYGYSKKNLNDLIEMSEITFHAAPKYLRAVADLLQKSANEIEKNKDWQHTHLQDEWKDWNESTPDIVVFNPKT